MCWRRAAVCSHIAAACGCLAAPCHASMFSFPWLINTLALPLTCQPTQPTRFPPWQLAERKDENGQTAYFVKWKGYEVDPAESGWLTEEGMDDVRARLVGRA